MIGQVKLGDFHVDLIILDKQNVEADKLFSCDPCLYFLNPLSLAVNVKRKPEYIRRSDALLARYLDRALHFFDQFFDDRHAKARSLVLRSRTGLLLCERMEQLFFDKFAAHSDAAVRDAELVDDPGSVAGDFARIRIDHSARLVVLDCIAEEIQHNLPQAQRTADQSRVRQLTAVRTVGNAHLRNLRIDKGCHIIHQMLQVKRSALDRLFSGLQLIHIEHIVDECQQMACGKIDFIEAVVHFCLILPVFADDIQHAHNAIDRRAHIVAHAVHKFCFCTTCTVCSSKGILKLYLLPLFPAVEL